MKTFKGINISDSGTTEFSHLRGDPPDKRLFIPRAHVRRWWDDNYIEKTSRLNKRWWMMVTQH